MKIRRLISLTTLIAFILLAFSGIMLFISPQGRVAYWAGWTLLGLSKDQYTALHTTFMILFLTVGIWHIVLNWRPIVGYLKDRTKKVRFTRPEFLTALGICLLFFVGPLAGMPPFQQLLDAGEGIKAYWERTHGSPPWGHAEESSLEWFCQRVGRFHRAEGGGVLTVDCQQALVALDDAGIAVEGLSQRIIDIANANGTTPQALSDIILTVAEPAGVRVGEGREQGVEGSANDPHSPTSAVSGEAVRYPHPGSGMGRITLREYADRFELDLEEMLGILRGKGLAVDPDERFRDAANRLGIDPAGILEVLNEGEI